ncbi:MAG: hypothetical protein KKC68_00430 [Candidatus Thermoplasmatota archaeon]|nr:hypothetical protein [Candidatus Thermoplasmatota archaeon]MBU1940218.1 hypothetical protein [Candidatus Thermoplasmatota archaeon]
MQKKTTSTKRTTISLANKELTELKELAKQEHRPMSRQIVHMMEFYKKTTQQSIPPSTNIN